MILNIFIFLAIVIIVALAGYALFLLYKLKKQKALMQHYQQQAIEKRNANIFENVTTLCMAGIHKQCDLSEIVIRVYCIMDYVQGDDRVDFSQEYPAIYELYQAVKDMPRAEERQSLTKKERMQQDWEREKTEARLSDAIETELVALKQRVAKLNTRIPVKMVTE